MPSFAHANRMPGNIAVHSVALITFHFNEHISFCVYAWYVRRQGSLSTLAHDIRLQNLAAMEEPQIRSVQQYCSVG